MIGAFFIAVNHSYPHGRVAISEVVIGGWWTIRVNERLRQKRRYLICARGETPRQPAGEDACATWLGDAAEAGGHADLTGEAYRGNAE